MSKICPYCFEEFNINKTPFRCVSPFSRCEPEVDSVLERVWEHKTKLGKVLDSPICSHCGEKSSKRLCPHCHQELPYKIFDCDNYIFAVIGAKSAGKSHYIPSFVEHIKKQVGSKMDMLLEGADERTRTRYATKFRDPLFVNRSVLPPNQQAFADSSIRIPMVFSLTFPKRICGFSTGKKRVLLISFFDTAGEDLNNEDTMALVNKYIYRADGILLLLDPLQLDYVRHRLEEKTLLPKKESEASDIITRVTSLVQKGREMSSSTKIETPLAVALSKWDAVKTLASNQLQVNTAASIQDTFNLSDFDAVNAEVQSLITQWDSEYLITQVKLGFSEYGFFGLSSLGSTPTETGAIPHIIPHRVTDPFLWLLYKNGLIKATNKV